MPHETIGYAWMNLEEDHDKKELESLNFGGVDCNQYPGHPYCDSWRNAQEGSLQNLINIGSLVKKGKKAVKIGKDAINVAKDAKHTYDDIRGLKLVNLNTDLDNRDAANRDHDFDLQNLMVNCAQYPGHPMCDSWRNAQETSLLNLDNDHDNDKDKKAKIIALLI